MTFDRLKEVVAKWRAMAEKNGCKDCGAKTELLLRGKPSLNTMVRGGAKNWDKIRRAVVKRGWFCKSCANKKVQEEADENPEVPYEEKQQQQLGMGDRYPPGDYPPGTDEWEEQAIYVLWPLKQPFEEATDQERIDGLKEYARRVIEVWPNEEDRGYYRSVLEKTNPPLFEMPV